MRRKIWNPARVPKGDPRLKRFLFLLSLAAAFGADRPPVFRTANFVVKTKFYSSENLDPYIK